MNLQGQVVIVTGAGSGIGAAMVDMLTAHGAVPCGADIKGAEYKCNVSKEDQVAALYADVIGEYGRVDAVIHCAGITRDSSTKKMTLEQFQEVLDVNQTGTFLMCREALRTIEPGGVIINISSCNRVGQFGQANYSGTKAAVVAMTNVWAREGARLGIRAVSIAPGYVKTPMTDKMKPETLEDMRQAVPLKRLGRAEEIADAARFILGNDYVNATVIEVDGGLVV